MPRRFRRQWKPTPVRKTVYLKNPVGSNEWVRQKELEYQKRKLDAVKKVKTE